jgi:hypothetical protein
MHFFYPHPNKHKGETDQSDDIAFEALCHPLCEAPPVLFTAKQAMQDYDRRLGRSERRGVFLGREQDRFRSSGRERIVSQGRDGGRACPCSDSCSAEHLLYRYVASQEASLTESGGKPRRAAEVGSDPRTYTRTSRK